MKPTNTIKKLWLCALTISALGFSACEKEDAPECSGAPAIDRVTLPTKRTEAFTTGNLADWVIIQGSNFCNVSSVMFNDVEANLSDAYVTSTEITVRIPRVVPKNVTNKVTVTSEAGTAETPYTLSIPPIEVAGLSNEYASAGQRVAVVGKNFDLYGISPTSGKVLWNGAPVTVTRATGDSVYFTVPANATPGATVKIVDANNVEKAVPGRYKDDRNIIFSYDTGTSVWNTNTFITQGPVPTPINGAFIRVNQRIGAWAWTEFSATNTTLSNTIIANAANYVLRFEVNTLKPFSTNVIKFSIDGDPGGSGANTYLWKPLTPFNTRGQWSTVTIKLSSLLTVPLDPNKSQHEFKFLFHGDGALDADMSFDNFRIVPKD
ncbi:glycan-binding surface protein [Hymenobacter sp.]|jgi:hypothetical protein|uniref:glycan-binding surface protein n=1 Tax=Hymenobacter sp. TaxID=1898978 RepID=UPI002EDA1E4D